MPVGVAFGVGVFGVVIGLCGRLLIPRPRVVSCVVTALLGLAGGLVGVALGARAAPSYVWVAGFLGAVFVVAIACWVQVGRAISRDRGSGSGAPPPERERWADDDRTLQHRDPPGSP